MLTLGALVAFIQYSQMLFQPIRDISDKYNVLQGAVVLRTGSSKRSTSRLRC